MPQDSQQGTLSDTNDELDLEQELEDAGFDIESIIDFVNPRDESGRFITREYDITAEEYDLYQRAKALGE